MRLVVGKRESAEISALLNLSVSQKKAYVHKRDKIYIYIYFVTNVFNK